MASTISAGLTTTTALVYTADTSGVLQLQTNGTTTAVTIDTNQNVGVGVTPSAWSLGKVLEIGSNGNGISGADQTDLYITQNTYFNGTNWIYSSSNPAGYYRQASGTHRFYTIPTGTSGATATPTQAMTLNNSGVLNINRTSPISNEKLSVTGWAYFKETGTTDAYGVVVEANANDAWLRMGHNGTVAVLESTYNATAGNTPLSFWTGASQRGQFDTNGNFLVGTTSTTVQNGFAVLATSPSYFIVGHASGTSSGYAYASFQYNASAIGSITQQGTTSVNFNGNSVPPSDQRLKENIVDAPSAQTFLNNIKVRSFDWIADKTHQTYGMIAQELMIVAPEVVPVPKDENTMMGVDYAKLVPALVKCVQELSVKVTALEAKVA